MRSLDYINPGESGISSFKPEEFRTKLKQRKLEIRTDDHDFGLLALFVHGKFTELDQVFNKDPSLVAKLEIKVLKILNDLCLGKTIGAKDIFPFLAPELRMRRKIGIKAARMLIKMHSAISLNLSNFATIENWQAINFWNLIDAIPEMRYVYCQHLLENNQSSEIILAEIKKIDASSIEDHEIAKQIEIEKKYLESFYYRRLGDEAKAELTKLEYIQLYKPDPEQSAELRSVGNEKFYGAPEVANAWQEILSEVDELQKDVEIKAGLSPKTCEYYGCSDCCSNTFPSMTATEWQYLEKWMQANNYPLAQVKATAEKIQADHEAKHGSRLKVVDKSDPSFSHRASENPYLYRFTCPFLIDKKCSIYPARPLLCRGFGLATDNNISLKTCKYYQQQYRHNSSPENERYCYDLREAQMLAASSDRHNNEGKHLIGTIVAWLSR